MEGMPNKMAFEPIEQGVINFMGRQIIKAQLKDKNGYIVLNSLADAFEITRPAFNQRIDRNSYFEPYVAYIRIDTRGGKQATLCMMAEAVPLFLAGTDLNRTKNAEGRALLEAFLKEAMTVLAEHFGISESSEIQFTQQMVARLMAEVDAQREGLSNQEELKRIKEEQERMQREHNEKINTIRSVFVQMRDQIRDYDRAAGEVCLNPDQRAQIKMAVDAIARIQLENGILKPYPGIYADLIRFTGRPTVETILKVQYADTLNFLIRQVQLLTGHDPDKEEPSI